MTTEYTHMLISLVGIVVLILVCVYVIKKFKLANPGGTQQLKIRNALAIGPKEKLLLVEVNKTVLLLGATPSHIETLYVFHDEATATGSSFTEQVVRMKQEETNSAIP